MTNTQHPEDLLLKTGNLNGLRIAAEILAKAQTLGQAKLRIDVAKRMIEVQVREMQEVYENS